jgi:hypothetical protein
MLTKWFDKLTIPSGVEGKAFLISTLIIITSICGTAIAKSVYAITEHTSGTTKAYQIQGNQLGIPYAEAEIEGEAIDITLDSQLKLLFLTLESGEIVCADANTLAEKDFLDVHEMAGIVADEAKQKVYSIARDSNQLYVFKWNGNGLILIDIVTLQNLNLVSGWGGCGVALDKMARRLYVSNNTSTVNYYDADDPCWAYLGSRDVGHHAMDIDVDSYHGYLYVGGYQEGAGDYTYLIKHNLWNDVNPNTEQDIRTSVIGLAVDPVTGLVYLTTLNKEIRVYDCSSYPFVKTYSANTEGDSGPAGICLDSFGGWMEITKVDDVDDGNCVGPGDYITYTIDYDYPAGPNHIFNDVNIIDNLPDEVDFNECSGPNCFQPDSNTVFWNLGTLHPGDSGSVWLKVKVKPSIEQGNEIINECEIRSDGILDNTAY